MPRRTADEASKTRSAILDAALLVFAELGVHAAQLEEVARRAGVTRGVLYHHFDGNHALCALLELSLSSELASVEAEGLPASLRGT